MSNKSGKGGFGDHPENINREGAPKRGQTWQESIKRITDMTREEAIEYVGKNTRIGRMLKELPPKLPLKDGLIFASIIAYGREPNARMLQALTDREEGKPAQTVTNLNGGTGGTQPLTIPADLIGSDFFASHRAIHSGKYNEFVEDGGRGSLKSSFISLEIIGLLVNHPTWHALATRQVKDTLRDSVYAQLVWAIDQLGLSESFNCTTSPMEITYTPTGQKVYFRGADDPAKIKSLKPPFGYVAIVWFEELDSFRGPETVRNIEQSAIRGGDEALIFKSFNPPRTAGNWANKYVKTLGPKTWHHTSTYLTAPPEWLGKAFIDRAEYLKQVNPSAYEHEYLGVPNFAGGMVFPNVALRKITDEEIKQFDNNGQGIDWGYFPAPFVWGRNHYDSGRHKIFIYDEYWALRKGNEVTFNELKEKGKLNNELIIADSAEPKSVGDYRAWGANIRAAEKGPDSINYSVKWFQSLVEIVIDPERAPLHAQQFTNYEYEQDKDGNYISSLPDKENDSIDETRYSRNLNWRMRGQ